MRHTPSDPRGPRLTRAHEILTSSRVRAADDAAGVRPDPGGTLAAAGFVFALLALAALWLDWAYMHTGVEAALLAGAIAGVGLVLALVGWRAGWASGASGRGPAVAAIFGAFALALAAVLLVTSW